MWFGGDKSKELTSLKLELPAPPRVEPKADAAPVQAAPTGSTEAQLAAAQEQMSRRTREILKSGGMPEEFFFALGTPNGSPVFLTNQQTGQRSLLLFTSPMLVMEYLRTTGVEAQIAGFKLEALPVASASWQNLRINSFVMNPCPHCGTHTILAPQDGVISREQIRLGWAVARAKRELMGQERMRLFMALNGEGVWLRQKEILEYLRDHVDYDNPYVHWMLALNARTRGDEEGRAAAVARLDEFGPAFLGKAGTLQENAGLEDWADGLAEVYLGLMMSFDMVDKSKMAERFNGGDAGRKVTS